MADRPNDLRADRPWRGLGRAGPTNGALSRAWPRLLCEPEGGRAQQGAVVHVGSRPVSRPDVPRVEALLHLVPTALPPPRTLEPVERLRRKDAEDLGRIGRRTLEEERAAQIELEVVVGGTGIALPDEFLGDLLEPGAVGWFPEEVLPRHNGDHHAGRLIAGCVLDHNDVAVLDAIPQSAVGERGGPAGVDELPVTRGGRA